MGRVKELWQDQCDNTCEELLKLGFLREDIEDLIDLYGPIEALQVGKVRYEDMMKEPL